MPYYAVVKGHKPGIYYNWSDCKRNIHKYSGAIYKKFDLLEDANTFVTTRCHTNSGGSTNEDVSGLVTKYQEYQMLSNEDIVEVYTDGSLFKKNHKNYCGYGYYIPELNIKVSKAISGKKTNNRAELYAIIESIRVIEELNPRKFIKIYTDSQYSIQIFNETGEKYKSQNYRKKGTDIINRDLVEIAMDLQDKYILGFVKVRSHTNNIDNPHIIGNGIADELAVKGAIIDYTNSCENISDYCLSFGKYKNVCIRDLDDNYIQWVLTDKTFSSLCAKNEKYLIDKMILSKWYNNIHD